MTAFTAGHGLVDISINPERILWPWENVLSSTGAAEVFCTGWSSHSSTPGHPAAAMNRALWLRPESTYPAARLSGVSPSQ
jgi:hypothetical protein